MQLFLCCIGLGASATDVELAIDKLKSHKSPGIDEVPAELIKAGVEQFAWRFIKLLHLFGRTA